MKQKWIAGTALAGLLAVSGRGALAADDWAQFRRDSGRSAASTDRVVLPLTEVWSIPGGVRALASPLYYRSASDLYFRWTPGVEAALLRVHHPLPGLDLQVSPTARFYGYPPVAAPTGVVAVDDTTYRFMTVLDGFPHNRWHRDMNTSLGIPASLQGSHSLFALSLDQGKEARTGEVERPGHLLLARRAIASNAPLLVEFDWLDPARAAGVGIDPHAPTTQQIDRLSRMMSDIAAEARPDHFNVAPEVNVYLARRPDDVGMVTQIVRSLGSAARAGYPQTRTVASVNVEVLRGVHAIGFDRPFGVVPRSDPAPALPLLTSVDEIGLPSYPQSAVRPRDRMAPDHLLAARSLLPDRPLLLTRVQVRDLGVNRDDSFDAASHVERVLEASYWLNARFLLRPEVLRATDHTERPGKTDPDPLEAAPGLLEPVTPAEASRISQHRGASTSTTPAAGADGPAAAHGRSYSLTHALNPGPTLGSGPATSPLARRQPGTTNTVAGASS